MVPVIRQRLFASVDAQYTCSVQTLAGNTVSGFGVFNATALGTHSGGISIYRRVSTTCWIRNISILGGREDPEDAIEQDGRTFPVKMATHF